MGLFNRLKRKSDGCKEKNIELELALQAKMDLITMSNVMLMETREELTEKKSISVPIGELAPLGGVVASLVPALRTVTQTTTIGTSGLYQLANEAVEDTLKAAKNGNKWASFNTINGSSKVVQLAEAGPLSATTQTECLLILQR